MKLIAVLCAGALLVAAPTAVFAGVGNSALIVHDGTGGRMAEVRANLATRLGLKGYTVTQNLGVPVGTLSSYQQVWDVRYGSNGVAPGNPFTSTEISEYQNYLSGGGSLFLMGENFSFATRNQAIADFIASTGGGSVSIANSTSNTQTVQAPFTGPSLLTTITYRAVGGINSLPKGAFITKDTATSGAAVVFGPGTLSGAPSGTLVAVFDVNFLDNSAGSNEQALADNIISYLGAPVSVPTMTEWAIIALMLLLLAGGIASLRLRRQPQASA